MLFRSIQDSIEMVGAGVVIRDHDGGVLGAACHFFPRLIDAEGAELLVCCKGLHLAKELQVQRVILETDNTGVAAKLGKEEQDRSLHGPVVEEIKTLLRGFGDYSIRSVQRSANVAAHILEKEGFDNKLCNVWCGTAPMCIGNQVALDSCMN